MQGVNISARRRARKFHARIQSLSGDGWLTFFGREPTKTYISVLPNFEHRSMGQPAGI